MSNMEKKKMAKIVSIKEEADKAKSEMADAPVKQTVEKIVKIDAKKVQRVKTLYGQMEKLAQNALDKAYEMGTLLIEIREELPPKNFIKYVEENFEFSYKSAQRWTQIAAWKPQIEEYVESHLDEFETEVELSDAQKIAKRFEEDAKAEFKDWEESQFVAFYPHDKGYKEALIDNPATDLEKPIRPWKDHDQVKNIDNHYAKWAKAEEAPAKPAVVGDTGDEVPDEDMPSIDDLLETAYSAAMSVLERWLVGDELDDARSTLADRFSSAEMPDY